MEIVEVAECLGSLWMLLIVISSVQGVCEEGWSGPRCDIKCHCGINIHCQNNGLCQPNEPCLNGYFGPGCQYVDLMHAEGSLATPLYIRDNIAATCSPDGSTQSVTISLKRSFRFTWLRLVLKDDNVQLNELRLTTNGQPEECPTQKWTIVSKVVDIICNTQMMVSTFTIKEPLATRLCSVHFSGGRNVALKQTVTMSSIRVNETAGASVDGERPDDPATEGLCDSTQVEAHPATWQLTFTNQYILYRVAIFSTPEFMHRLARLALKTYSSNSTVLDTYVGTGRGNDTTLDITLPSAQPVKQIRITAGVLAMVTDGVLTLCEVEAYGMEICQEGRYGLSCDQTCTCLEQAFCFAATGGCMSGCPSGFYGIACDKNCPSTCVNSTCNPETGNCLICSEGRTGATCSDSCPKGRFGSSCTRMCSGRCSNNDCNPVTGDCLRCPTGRSGPECNECPHGTFGNNCSESCPVNCNNSMCDRIAGTCFSCTKTFQGSRCTDCAIGKFGDGCKSDCPANCNKRLCHEITGVCRTCTSGFEGRRCEVFRDKEGESNLAYVFPFFAIVPIIFGVIAFCIKRKKSRDKQSKDSQVTKPTSSQGE